MTTLDSSPLTPVCFKALTDKMYEKRKTAAKEVEKTVKVLMVSDMEEVVKLLDRFGGDGGLVSSKNPNYRKGGLIGLASIAIALQEDAKRFTSRFMDPIMRCLEDGDTRVKYYACEALYNVMKVLKGEVMVLFNIIFRHLTKLTGDPDHSVKSGADMIDRVMKAIVTEQRSFELNSFLDTLNEALTSPYSNTQNFGLSWLQLLSALEYVDLIPVLPDILNGLFYVLNNPITDVSQACYTFLLELKTKTALSSTGRADFSQIVPILSQNTRNPDNRSIVRLMCVQWMKECVTRDTYLVTFSPSLLSAILPCLEETDQPPAHEEQVVLSRMREIESLAHELNETLMHITTKEYGKLLERAGDETPQIDFPGVINELLSILRKEGVTSRSKLAALKWIYSLHCNVPEQLNRFRTELLKDLLEPLFDYREEDAVVMNLEILAKMIDSNKDGPDDLVISNNNPDPFRSFICDLVIAFSKHQRKVEGNDMMYEGRGEFIIRQLCLMMNQTQIYRTFSMQLFYHQDLGFVSFMVRVLNRILMTSTECFPLRNQLKDLSDPKTRALFDTLFKTWAFNPTAAVSLCLLSRRYSLSCDMVKLMAQQDLTIDILKEVDELVQLIESPLGSFLRIHLLNLPSNLELVTCLYGLLMILPQGETFHSLHKRLQCIPMSSLNPDDCINRHMASPEDEKDITHFRDVQDRLKVFSLEGMMSRF